MAVYNDKVRFTIDELMKTEEDYVEMISLVKNEFIPGMEAYPVEGREDKVRLIFGNMVQIYEWHRGVFHKALRECEGDPFRIAEAFIMHKREFHMYVRYCENSKRANLVAGENANYFQKLMDRNPRIRIQVKDVIMRPVQRIMKYQLLLDIVRKGLAKDGFDATVVEEAIEAISSIPANANDMMSVTRIKHFPGKLTAQGPLFLQGQITIRHKGQTCLRQVFLMEQSVIITTSCPPTKRFDLPDYDFVALIRMTFLEIKITESHAENQFLLLNTQDNSEFVFIFEEPHIFAQWRDKLESLVNQRLNLLTALFDPSGPSCSPVQHSTYQKSPMMSFLLQSPPLIDTSPLVSQLEPRIAFLGQEITMRVEFFALPYPTIRWTKDDLELTHGIQTVGFCSYLTISLSSADDCGEYLAEVSNSHGTVTSTCSLTVLSDETNPIQPPKVYPSDRSTVRVDWTETYVNKFTYELYDLQICRGGQWTCIALNLDCSTYDVTGLPPATPFTFRIVPILHNIHRRPSQCSVPITLEHSTSPTLHPILRLNLTSYYRLTSKPKISLKSRNSVISTSTNTHYIVKTFSLPKRLPEIFEILARCRMPHLISAFECFSTTGNSVSLVLEDVGRLNLFEFMASQTSYHIEVVVFFMAQLLRALQFLEKHKILHNNIKPESIYTLREKSHMLLKLGDFDFISKQTELPPNFEPDVEFSAPELMTLQGPHCNSDLWSAGAVMYTLIEGESFRFKSHRRNQQGSATVKVIENKSSKFSDFLQSLMAHVPHKRSSAAECLGIIDTLAKGGGEMYCGKKLGDYLALRSRGKSRKWCRVN